jgi:transcriptional regulator with XRE-family HTH domain
LIGTHHMSSKRERGDPVTQSSIQTPFGLQLRRSRLAVGLSLRQLATRIGYDHSYLSQVERGRRAGSADLARRCDQELGADGRLTATFEPSPAPAGPARPEPEPQETAWRALVGALSAEDQLFSDFRAVPPASLLPALIGQLQGAEAQEAAELSILIAETQSRLGDPGGALRWWWAARAAADSVGAGASARSREVIIGLAERRPLPELLELAEEAVGLDRQAPTDCLPRAAQALVLAELGRRQDAHRALQELIGVDDQRAPTPAYLLHWVEGRLCTLLGYGVAGCVLLQRARELCPTSWVGDRARLDLCLAECLAVAGEVPAALAMALRTLVELPDEWHDSLVYDAADRVLCVVQQEPGATELRRLLARHDGRSVGSGSSLKPGQA